jgi:hypothetical protein
MYRFGISVAELGLGVVLLVIFGTGRLGDFYNRFDVESFEDFGLWWMLG